MTTPAAAQRRAVRTPVVVVTVVAWVLLVLLDVAAVAAAGEHHGGAGVSGGADHHASTPSRVPVPTGTAGVVLSTALMLVAMMAPMTVGTLRERTARVLPRHRPTTVVLVLGGWGVVWAAALAVSVPLLLTVSTVVPTTSVLVVALAVAAVWQCSPARQRALNASHRRCTPRGRAWHHVAADDLRAGFRQGAWCVATCGPLMAVPLVAGSAHLVTMAAVSAWLWAEHLEPPRAPAWSGRPPRVAVRLVTARLVRTPARRGATAPVGVSAG